MSESATEWDVGARPSGRPLSFRSLELELGAGVEVVGELGRGADTVVYHVRRGGVDYALKVLCRSVQGDDRGLAGFCREAAVLARVDHPGVPRVFDVGSVDGYPYLVMELVGGESLADVLRGGVLDEGRLVEVAADVAAALSPAHRTGLVHRDIKPANLLVTPTGLVRVIDFGLATQRATASADVVAGTFDYSAPEQTGMLACPVDGRADLYALGVVLFEAATGSLPFRADDVGELLTMHATAPVPDPRQLRPALSAALAELIVRLLAKDPDDRVQTAADLHGELVRLGAAAAEPGGADRDGDAAPLVGREDECRRLAERWQVARTGGGGVALVTGAAGAGKSSVTREVAEVAREAGALVLAGRCDRDSALLAPLRAAVDGYLGMVSGLPPERRGAAIARLRAAAGMGAGLLRTLSPALATLLDAPRLAAEEQPERFIATVTAFLEALARENGGLLLLLVDDVQWLDPTSRAVIRQLAQEIADAPVLVVATARDDEPNAAAVAAFEADTGQRLDLRVRLGPLDDAGVAKLVSGYLTGSDVGEELVAEIAARAHGNPFAIMEYLYALIESGALRPSWGTWRLDTRRLRALELPADVIELVLARIDGLGADARRFLSAAAAIGSEFATDLLAVVVGADPGAALAEAARRGLVQTSPAGFVFVHDRLREALLSALAPPERRRIHQRIAVALDDLPYTDPAHVYAVARHYADGETDQTPERVFATGRAAGELALADGVPHAAITFLQAASAAARSAGIPPDSQFGETLGVAYLRAGEIEPARTELEAALAAAATPERRAALLLQLTLLECAAYRLTQAAAYVNQGLAELGRPMPRGRVPLGMAALRTLVWWLVTGGRRPSDHPSAGDIEAGRILVQLCRAGAGAYAGNMRPLAMLALVLHGSRDAHRLGRSAEYVIAQCTMGVIFGGLRLRRRRERLFRRAAAIAADMGDPRVTADVAWTHMLAKVAGKDAQPEQLCQVVEEHRRWLDLDNYLSVVFLHATRLVGRGYAQEALRWFDRGRGQIAHGFADRFPGYASLAATATVLLGRPVDAGSTSVELLTDDADVGTRAPAVLAAVHAAVEQDELDGPFEAAVSAFHDLGVALTALVPEYRLFFVYQAFGRLTRCQRSPAQQRAESLAAAERAVDQLRRAADDPLLRAYHAVARAALWQLRGEHQRAVADLARAEPLLAGLDAPLVDYEAARVRARAHRALGAEAVAERHAEIALLLATRHEWAPRARWIRTEFGVSPSSLRRTGSQLTSAGAGGELYRRRLAALQQISAAAAKVLDPQALTRVALDETLRILGGERAMLFLTDADGTLRPSLGRDTAGQDLTELVGYSSTLVERVCGDKEPIVITGSVEGAAMGSQSAVVHGLRSIMVAPLELDGRLLGVVYLDSRVAKGVFLDEDVAILTAVTSHVAAALETARAAQLEVAVHVAREQRDSAETLRAAMTELSTVLDPEQVLERLLSIVTRTIPADRVWLLRADGARLLRAEPAERATAADGGEPPTPGITHLDLAGVDTASLLASPTPEHGSGAAPAPALRALLGDVRCWLAVPVTSRAGGDSMLVAASDAVDEFTATDVDFATVLAGQGATAYDNAQLFSEVQRLATTDGMTGLYNRRHFSELAGRALAVAQRNHRPLTGMMIDIDHFKKINDTWGHATGDDVIRAVAATLLTNLRDPDILGRYGGEEFALLLNEMQGDPVEVAERLRAAVAATAVAGPGATVRVTVSIGIADLKTDDSLDILLARADNALYQAKQAGRNQVKSG